VFKAIARLVATRLTDHQKSLADCIKTNEFMHVYNAIIVLKEILPVFPLSAVIDLTGPPLNQVIETFIEKEERGDLKILARAYAFCLISTTQPN